jgi:WD40 repeat protein
MDEYVAHENKIEEVQVSPDGQAVLTAGWDTYIKIWTY